MATPELPEPMNSSPHHSKVKITTTLSDPTFVAGNFVSGKLDMECRADRGLGIGILMVELFAIQELSSRDHSATSTFLHSRRLFQGPGLPPSNAVQAHIMPGDSPLPQHYYQARRGKSTFLFRIPIPPSSPSSISFASGLAKVRYELRASVGVYWKNEKRLVVDNKTVDIVEAYPYEESLGGPPEAIVVGDNGKLWMQGRMIGGAAVAGGSACLEIQVKNHSNKKNSSLTLTLTRTLYLPGQQQQQPATVQISDTLTTVPFRGPEYIIPPAAEGVANLVFDIPKYARGVRGGILDGEGEEDGGQPRQTESLFEIRCKVEVKLGMGIGSKDIILEIPIDVVHPMAVPQQPVLGPFTHHQQSAPYTYANHAPVPELMPYTDYTPYYSNQPAYIDPTQIQPWLPPMEPPLLLPHGYPHGYAPSPGPQMLPPFEQFYPLQVPTGDHTPPAPHLFFPDTVPGLPPPDLPHLPPISYQTPIAEPIQPAFITMAMAPHTDNFVSFPDHIPIPNPPSSTQNSVVHSPRPQLTPKHSFTRDPVLGSLTISKSVRVEELEKMADEVAKRSGDLSRDLLKVVDAAGGPDEDYPNLNKTLPGPPVPSGKFGGRKKGYAMNDDDDVNGRQGLENHDQEEPQRGRKRRDLMSVFPAATHDHQVVQAHPQEPPPPAGGITYQTPPTPTLMAVLGPYKQTLPPSLPPTATKAGRSPNLLTSENGLDALERRLLAEVGTRKHLEAWDNANDSNIITEEIEDGNGEEENGRRRYGMKTKVFKDHHQLGRRDVRDILDPLDPAAKTSMMADASQRLPPIDTDLDLDLLGREEGADSGGREGGGGGGSAPIPIPKKSPDPLNESVISSLTLGGEGLVSGLATGVADGTGAGTGLASNDGGPSHGRVGAGAGDSDADADADADFDGRTHRAGSASLSGGPNSGSDRVALGTRPARGGFHKHMRQRAEAGTPTKTTARERGKSRKEGSGRGIGGGGLESNEKSKTSSSKKKERLNGIGSSGEAKKSRNKSSAAAKGRVAAWLGGIDFAVPPQEEIIPPSPSVVRDLDAQLFEDEQRAAIGLLGRSPLAAAPLFPSSPDPTSPTTPGGALVSNVQTNVGGNGDSMVNGNDEDAVKVVSASPNPRSSGFVPITTLKRDTISLPSLNSAVRRPLLLSRDATVIEEARKVQELWSSTPPGINLDKDTLKPGVGGAISHERNSRKPSSSKPAGVMPLSYSAAVTSAPAAASAAPRNVWKNADQIQPISQPKGVQLPPSTTKPSGYKLPNGKLPVFPPSKPPIDSEVKYDIRSARGGRGGKVSSVASLWASGAINSQSYNHQRTTPAVKGKAKEVPKWLLNDVEEVPDSSSSVAPVKPEKKLFSAAVMTPASGPAIKNIHAYSPAVGSGSGGDNSGLKKVTSTPTLPTRAVGISAGSKALAPVASASRPTENIVAVQTRPRPATTTNVLPSTPTANLSTPNSSTGPPTGKLQTKGGVGGAKGFRKPATNGPPGVMIKATSDPAVISSSLAVPTLSSTASLIRPHHQNSGGQKQNYHLQPRVAVVKLPTPFSSTPPGSGSGSGSSVSPRPRSPQVVINNANSNPSKPVELAFGQGRLRDLIKKYQGSPSPAGLGQKT